MPQLETRLSLPKQVVDFLPAPKSEPFRIYSQYPHGKTLLVRELGSNGKGNYIAVYAHHIVPEYG